MKNEVQHKLNSYPEHIRPLLLKLRSLILEIADTQDLGPVEETLKWGEPSYATKGGSPVRFDWKPKYPDHYFIFFNCNTKLIETFRLLHADILQFEGNRAIVLEVKAPLPTQVIRHCLERALKYKSIKHLPFLDA